MNRSNSNKSDDPFVDCAVHDSIEDIVDRVKRASVQMTELSGQQRQRILDKIAQAISDNAGDILEANKLDIINCKNLVARGELPESFLNRLKLDIDKLADIVDGIKQVAALEDPIGRTTLARELDHNLNLYRITCSIGVIATVFESRPDALPQIVSLCVKSGNAVILKGGKEAEHSNKALFECIQSAAEQEGLPPNAMVLIETREDVNRLLKADKQIDLIIPRGSNALVKYIQEHTKIPVLGHAEGVCHLYVDESADTNTALKLLIDSKVQYPAACNSIETLLVHKNIATEFLPKAVAKLQKHKVEIRVEQSISINSQIQGNDDKLVLATEDDWCKEYCDLIISVKIVDAIDAAIDHINKYGSGHTEAIVTENMANFEQFFAKVNSANVFCNASTRFADGFRYGFGAEVGISTGKLHPRGPVGLEGLVTYKYQLKGDGHIVADYIGPNAKQFTHKRLKAK
jgi:glutamate-5-semialdehyde dehydrogenase